MLRGHDLTGETLTSSWHAKHSPDASDRGNNRDGEKWMNFEHIKALRRGTGGELFELLIRVAFRIDGKIWDQWSCEARFEIMCEVILLMATWERYEGLSVCDPCRRANTARTESYVGPAFAEASLYCV